MHHLGTFPIFFIVVILIFISPRRLRSFFPGNIGVDRLLAFRCNFFQVVLACVFSPEPQPDRLKDIGLLLVMTSRKSLGFIERRLSQDPQAIPLDNSGVTHSGSMPKMICRDHAAR